VPARYDTERTVTAFAARLQGETDIAVVRADLLATINQTLEPVQLTVWLNPGPENGGQQAMPDPGRRP